MRFKTGVILAFVLRTAGAEVITSTFGPADAFVTIGGYQVGGGAITGRAEELAVAFTPEFDAALTQIRVAVLSTSLTVGDRDLIVDLSEGPVPDAPLETFATTVLDGDARIYTFNSALHPMLTAGQTYWIVLTSNDLVDNFFGWNTSETWRYSTMAERTARSSQWQLFYDAPPAFDVSGRPSAIATVPEPATMLGVGLALLLVGLRRRRTPEMLRRKER
jgi:hypothetical protein